jgi:CheY-like chemotaxis protein
MRALCETLELEGYFTSGFSSPQEALWAVPAGEFDLLITDLMMPGNGRHCAAQGRARD